MSEEFQAPEASTDQVGRDDGEQGTDPVGAGRSPERTGNHDVDRVLSSLEALDDLPIDEHVAVFERAHENLRGALDGPRPPHP